MGANTSVILASLGTFHIEHQRRVEEEDRRRHDDHQRWLREEAEREREQKRNEEERRRNEEERKRNEEEKRRIEEERKRFEAEKKREKEAEEKRKKEDETRKKEDETRRKEEETRKKEAEAVKKRNDDEKKKNEEQKRKNEEQRRRTEEETKANEERKRKLEEEAKANEEKERRLEEEAKANEEIKRNLEEEAKANEEKERKLEEEAKANKEKERKLEEEAKANEEKEIKLEIEARANEERGKKLEEEEMKIRKEIEAAEEKSRADMEARKLAEDESARCKLDLDQGIQPVKWPTQEEFDSVRERLDYREDYFHFAITGTAGSGKSSLINAFRGFKNSEAGAAPVGVTETTQEIGRYPDPDNTPPRAWTVWFDVPGAGTIKIPDWQYFNEQGLFIFDLVIVAVDARLTKIDISILENCRRFKIPSFIVRSKANQHIKNVMQDMGYDSDDDDPEVRTRARMEFIRDTRRSFDSVLREASLPSQKTYIVSNTAICALIKAQRMPKDIIDEVDLIKDLLLAAHRRHYPDQT
ncbi:hypothetical protein Q9L58_003695 [Maublancomyces gigas]|uniref:IRG-type G domain-containing protein n=1 Tax=Discina gigas TaxID=1032678 RepID=A0ABR3GNN7_9PEZI